MFLTVIFGLLVFFSGDELVFIVGEPESWWERKWRGIFERWSYVINADQLKLDEMVWFGACKGGVSRAFSIEYQPQTQIILPPKIPDKRIFVISVT